MPWEDKVAPSESLFPEGFSDLEGLTWHRLWVWLLPAAYIITFWTFLVVPSPALSSSHPTLQLSASSKTAKLSSYPVSSHQIARVPAVSYVYHLHFLLLSARLWVFWKQEIGTYSSPCPYPTLTDMQRIGLSKFQCKDLGSFLCVIIYLWITLGVTVNSMFEPTITLLDCSCISSDTTFHPLIMVTVAATTWLQMKWLRHCRVTG